MSFGIQPSPPSTNLGPRRKFRVLLVVLLLSCLTLLPARAVIIDNNGNDFWLAVPANENYYSRPYLFIAGTNAATGTLSIPDLSITQAFSVPQGGVTTITLPGATVLKNQDTVTRQGIHITTSSDVAVYLMDRVAHSSDATVLFPTDALGKNYLTLTYKTTLDEGFKKATSLVVIGTQDATRVTITLPITVAPHAAGVPYDITLNQGDTYQLAASGIGSDLTGASVEADHPIVVYGTHSCTNLPDNYGACDLLLEQLPPLETWGKDFLSMPLATRKKGDSFRILASHDGTTVRLNGSTLTTLNRGQFWGGILDGPNHFQADQPVLVAQYSNGYMYDNVLISDPFMLYIVPTEQYLAHYVVAVPETGFKNNFLNLIAPQSLTGAVTLNGAALPAAVFTPIASSGFSGTQVKVVVGTHTLSANLPFAAMVYGFDNADSYGYAGGFSLGAVASLSNLTLSPLTAERLVGTSHCVTATVSDTSSAPLPGIRVDFAVSGTLASLGSVFSDANGQAVYCYQGTVTGSDRIVAVSGSQAATVSCAWVEPSPTPTPTETPLPALHLWPNPFNPAKAVRGTLKAGYLSQDMTLGLYTLSGETLARLAPSNGWIEWQPRTKDGRRVAPGIYYYVFRKGEETLEKGALILE